MPFFPCAHAGHPVWQHATKQVCVQLRAQIGMQNLPSAPRLGLVYVSQNYAPYAGEIVAMLARSLPHVQHWVGSAAHGVLGGDMDYGLSGALSVMLPCLEAGDYQVFSGLLPWQQAQAHVRPRVVLVHGDASTPGLPGQLAALQAQMPGASLVGGASRLQGAHAQWAWGGRGGGAMPASIGGGGVQVGGVSGLVLGDQVSCMAVGMQGCKPHGPRFTITHAEGTAVLALDGQPALHVLRAQQMFAGPSAMGMDSGSKALVALSPPQTYAGDGCVAAAAQVLRVMAVDELRGAIELEVPAPAGYALVVCERDELAARNDLRRACAEIWESLTAEPSVHGRSELGLGAAPASSIGGAVYIRSHHRQVAPRQPQVDVELQLIRHALGPVPLLGFTTTQEIDAGSVQHLSAQLLVFTQPLPTLS